MSENPIKDSEFFEGDPFEKIKKTITDSLGALSEYDESLKSIAKTLKDDLNKVNEKRVEGLSKLNNLEADSNKKAQEKRKNISKQSILEKEYTKLLKQKRTLEAREITLNTQRAKKVLELRDSVNQQTKSIRDNIKATRQGTVAYSKLSKESTELSNRSKNLGAQLVALERAGKKNTKEYRNVQKQYQKVTKEAKQLSDQLIKVDKNVNQGSRTVGLYERGVKGLTSTLQRLGLAFGVFQIVRNVSGIVADFNQRQQDLLAISGKTEEELSGLTQQAKDLGATTAFSATQITELQIELAKLGFTTDEITKGTGGISAFASATGADLSQSAKIAGSALRAFNLDASEMDRVVSVLGVATTKTALNVSALETGLSSVAPVAASFGFSIEDTTALLGQLSNAGFDASSAATSTRNILLNLADANGELAQKLGRPIKNADDLAGALKELEEKGVDLGEALELTDKRSVAAFQTFIQGADSLVDLRDSITDVNDELLEMEEKRLDSISGQLQLLSSAWEGFVLSTDEATGASVMFKNIIGFLAENLGIILGLATKGIGIWALWRLRMVAVNLQQSLFSKNLISTIRNLPNFIRGINGATFSIKNLGKAFKLIPFLGTIALIGSMVSSLFDLISTTDHAADAQERLNKAQKDGQEEAKKIIDARAKDLQKELSELDRVAQNRIKLGEDEKKVNEELLSEKEKLTEKELDLIDRTIEARKNATDELTANIKKEIKQLEERFEKQTTLGKGLNPIKQSELKEELNLIEANSNSQIKEYEKRKEDLLKVQENLSVDIIAEEKKLTQEQIKEQRRRQAELEALIRKSEDLEDARIEDELERSIQKIERQFSREIALIKGNSEAENRLRRNLKIKRDLDIEQLEKEHKERLIKEEKDYWDRIKAIQEENQKKDLEQKEDEFQQELKGLERLNQKKELANLQAGMTQEEFNDAEQKRQIAHLDRMIELYETFGKNTLDLQIEKEKVLQGEIEKIQRETVNVYVQVQQNLTKFINQAVDDRISELQREQKAYQDHISTLEKASEQGNINTKKSIAEAEKLRREALLEEERMNKRKQRIDFISSALQNVQNQLNQGNDVGTALGSTIALQSGLAAIFAGFQGFYKGTQNAPEGWAWLHEKGGEIHTDKHGNIKELGDSGAKLRYLEKGDKVIPHEKTMSILNNSIQNDMTSPISNNYQKTGMDFSRIESAILNSNKQLIDKVNSSQIDIEQLGRLVNVILTQKKNGMTTIKKFKA